MVAIPSDGRITSLTTLGSPLAGTEVMYIVSPGNANFGISYQIPLNTIAGYMSSFPAANASIITSGATYNAKTTDTRILAFKTVGSSTSVVMPAATSMVYASTVLIKDIKGDAGTNNITISFTGGDKCDNLSSVVINTNYGWIAMVPTPAAAVGASAWYLLT